MMLLSTFITPIPPQVSRKRGVGVTYESIKRSNVPWVESSINSCANIFGASYESDRLKNDPLKNDHTIDVTLPTLYAIDIHRESWDTTFTNSDSWYVVELGG